MPTITTEDGTKIVLSEEQYSEIIKKSEKNKFTIKNRFTGDIIFA